MELATFIGISISEFWEITPFELNIYAKSYTKRQEQESKERLTLAYLNARWTIQWLGKKKDHPKPLDEILNIKEKKVMTDKQMLEQVKILNTIFGGEVRTVGKE